MNKTRKLSIFISYNIGLQCFMTLKKAVVSNKKAFFGSQKIYMYMCDFFRLSFAGALVCAPASPY